MQSKIRRKSASQILMRSATVLTFFLLASCGTRAILEQPGLVIYNAKEIKGAKVLVPDAKGNMTPATATIPEGAAIVIPMKAIATPAELKTQATYGK